MKRKSWITAPIIIGLVISLALCLSAYVPEVFALTNSEVDPNANNIAVGDAIETTTVTPEPKTHDPLISDTTEETLVEATTFETEPDFDTTKAVSEKTGGCDHFWRREYEPETETEAGCIFDSCLYCGKWHVVETIPPTSN